MMRAGMRKGESPAEQSLDSPVPVTVIYCIFQVIESTYPGKCDYHNISSGGNRNRQRKQGPPNMRPENTFEQESPDKLATVLDVLNWDDEKVGDVCQ
jgi:hypothetical protein